MVKITIIGWYGTETIGDRAILAGICSILRKNFGTFSLELGTMYPFFSERTLIEDYFFLTVCAANKKLAISLFDTQNIKSLRNAIRNCDVLVMGGGPLMGFWSMYMIEYAFSKARKMGKKTMVLGCGVGPMIKREYEKCLVNIIRKSDVTIFRDIQSAREYQRISKDTKELPAAIDPAAIAVRIFNKNNKNTEKQEHIVACIRDFPAEYKINSQVNVHIINWRLASCIAHLQQSTDRLVKLIPMHYFAVGEDDRKYMNQLKFRLNNDRIVVQNAPLTLEETLVEFSNASACIGMRFHSVVLQTLLNGKNLVLDYTDPEKGKIVGFLKSIQAFDYYKESYVNLQTSDLIPSFQDAPFIPDNKVLNRLINTYNNLI